MVDVRLTDGSYPSEGRVEVFLNGVWGTVMDDHFGMEDARVVCKSLGYGGAANELCCSVYGDGGGPIHMDDVGCSGNEASISDCTYSKPGADRPHNEDQGVRC